MADLTTAFWGMTVNNYTETDLALVRNGYPDHMRELVYTLEEGEEGTPHIQAWIKLKRQQRLSFLKKLFPTGHFRALCSAEYQQNTKVYAQKLDGTSQSPAVHTFNDPIHTIEGIARRVINQLIQDNMPMSKRPFVEHAMVQDDYTMAKVFVSATYKQMFKQYGESMYECLYMKYLEQQDALEQNVNAVLENDDSDTSDSDTHTDTHTRHPFFSPRITIPTIDADETEDEDDEDEGSQEDSGSEEDSGTEDDDCSASETGTDEDC